MSWKCVTLLAVLHVFWIANATAQPSVFWFNDPVGPDETVLVTGAELDAVTAVTVSRIPDPGSAAAPQQEEPVAILQANPLCRPFDAVLEVQLLHHLQFGAGAPALLAGKHQPVRYVIFDAGKRPQQPPAVRGRHPSPGRAIEFHSFARERFAPRRFF